MASSLFARVLRNRRAVRLPIPLFRRGLGFLFGGRLLLLEHVGRTSGLARYVALEVVKRESPQRVVVASGFGERAQWYQNLRATPRCHVSIGFVRRAPARATFLEAPERDPILAEYRREHPGAWRKLESAIVELTGDAEPDIPLVRLELAPG